MKRTIVFVVLWIFLKVLISAAPVNDDPCNAIELEVVGTCILNTFTNVDATSSTGITPPGCALYSGGDVWFKFTMPNNGFHTRIEMTVGTMGDAGMAVYAGNDCNNLVLVACDDDSGTGGMPVIDISDGCNFDNSNVTYWIRVWEEDNDANGTFDICAYGITPPTLPTISGCGAYPASGNACCDAPLLYDDLDGFCGTTLGYNDQPDELPMDVFCAFLDNNVWISFVAPDTLIEIEILVSDCVDHNGLQARILETNDCIIFTPLSDCWNPGSETNGYVTASDLIPGNIYYLMIDGWAGDDCSFELNIPNPPVTCPTASDYEICQGESTQLNVEVIGIGPYTYSWSPDDGSLSDANIKNPVASPNVSTDYTLTITGGINPIVCDVSILVYPSVPSTPNIFGSNMICQNTMALVYNAGATNATSFSWSVSGGGTIIGASNLDSLIVDWGMTDGQICVTANNDCGDSPMECLSITALVQPQITAETPAAICAPNAFDLSTVVLNNTGGDGSKSYYEDMASAEGAINAISPLVYTSGTYIIRMQTGDDCYDLADVTITIEEPQFNIVNPPSTCAPNTIDLSNNIVTETSGLSGTFTYYLDTLDAVNEANVLASTVVEIGGTYWVRFETILGCFKVAPIEINIVPEPDLSVAYSPSICTGDEIDLDTITLNDVNNTTLANKYFYTSQALANLCIPSLALNNTIVNTPGCYYACIENTGGCRTILEICINEETAIEGQISGGGTVCGGQTIDLVFDFTGTGPYDVTYSDGSTNFDLTGIDNGHIETIVVNANTTFTLLTVSNGSSCGGTVVGTSVDAVISGASSGSISGTTSICNGGTTNLTFNFTGTSPFDIVYQDNNGEMYSPNDLLDGHIISVNPTMDLTYTLISVTDDSGCIGTISGSAIITVDEEVMISNIVETCVSSMSAYIVSFEINGGDASNYSITGGTGSLTGNLFTSDEITSGTDYSFSINDGGACDDVIISGTKECSCLTDAGTMNQDLILVCEGASITATHNGDEMLQAGDLMSFVLHDNAGLSLGNISDTNGAPIFLLNGLISGTTYYISAIAGPDDGTGNVDLTHNCLSVSAGTPVQFVLPPEASISGTTSICNGESTMLTINIPVGTPPFDVTYSDGDVPVVLEDILDGHQIMVSPTETTTYFISQIVDNTSAACSGPGTGNAVITVNEPLQIINLTETCDASSLIYVVSFEVTGGDVSNYVEVGASGSFVGNIFTSNDILSGTAYNFSISDGSTCSPAIVNGMKECECLTNSGTMDTQLVEVCVDDNATAIHNGDEILDNGDLFEFVLHDGTANSLGEILTNNTTATFGFQIGMSTNTTYYISAIAGPDDGTGSIDLNHNCFSSSNGTPVSFIETPEVTVSGSAAICAGLSTDLVFTFSAGTGPFDITYSDGGSPILLDDISDGYVLSVSPTVSTDYSIISVVDNSVAMCSGNGSGLVSITVIDAPVFSNMHIDCNDTNTAYMLSFEVAGGDASTYSFTGDAGTFDATTNIFTSEWMPSGSTYSFEVSDAGNCSANLVEGEYTCACTSASGAMDLTLLEVCETTNATASHDANEILDGDDALGFVLHDGTAENMGDILQSSNIPTFTYDASEMTYGIIYYISAIVGNDDGGGFPVTDISLDPCLSISEGQAIVFYQTPIVSLSLTGQDSICLGDETQLTFNIVGSGPFDIQYAANTDTFSLNNINAGYQLMVSPIEHTVYTLVGISNSDFPNCIGEIDLDSYIVEVEVLDFPSVDNIQVNCNDDGTAFTLSFEITGGDTATYVVNGDPGTLVGNLFTSIEYPSGASYYFEVSDTNACYPVILNTAEYCNCTPDIFAAINIEEMPTCNGFNDAALSATNINGEAPFSFEWNTGQIGTEIENLTAGWYFVTMTDANNCQKIDSTYITEPDAISANLIAEETTCFGDSDGGITFANVNGGVGDYVYSIEGTFPSRDSIFSHLDSGVYMATIFDDSGCEWSDTVTIVEPPELIVDLGQDTIIQLGDSIQLNPIVNMPYDSFYWEYPSFIPCTDCMEPMITPIEQRIYRLTVIDEKGCEATDEILLTVSKERLVYIPTGFSPNGDGENDEFMIYAGSGIETISELSVYTRWGEEVFKLHDFQPNDEAMGWDGRFKSKEMPTGVYIYFARIQFTDGREEMFSGDVSIIR